MVFLDETIFLHREKRSLRGAGGRGQPQERWMQILHLLSRLHAWRMWSCEEVRALIGAKCCMLEPNQEGYAKLAAMGHLCQGRPP